MTIILSLALAQPQLIGGFVLSDSSALVQFNVSGESPLEIDIPDNAEITGANYSDGTAVFNESFSYSYSTTDIIADSNGEKIFLFVFDQPTDFDYVFGTLLPVGRVITSTAPEALYFSDGHRIGVRWSGTGNQAQFSLRYKSPLGPIVQFVETDIPIVDKTIFLPGIILAFLFGYFLAAGTVTALLQRVRHITARMNEEEKSITYLLRDGPLAQSKIQKQLNFSKAKLSRTLREMEERGIVEKTPKGKTNVISLK